MEKKWWIIIPIIGIVLIITIIIFLKSASPSLGPQSYPSELTTCKTLSYNGENKINLVFISDKSTAEEYSSYLLDNEPYKTKKENFNIFYIDSINPECELYKGIAILCYSKDLVKKASSCPNDYTIVVKEEPSNIRSSAYMNVLSINSNHPESVILHEFGHSFANLAEEYTPAKIPRKSKNCVSSCDEFNINDGCFEGCSQENYKRSIESGVMRTLSTSNYGDFNNQLISQKIQQESTSSITGQAIHLEKDCTKEQYYLIQGQYNQNNINILDTTIEQGCIGKNRAGDLDYNIIMNDNSIISKGEFNAEFIFTESPGENQIDGEVYESDRNFLLKIPIIDNSQSLEILENNNLISQVNINEIGGTFCKK